MLNFNAQATRALEVMLVIVTSERTYTPVQVIAERAGLSASYVEQLVSKLASSGLVISSRGPNGGYTLGMDSAADISLRDIICSVDAFTNTNQQMKESCAADAWENASKVINANFRSVKLSDLLTEN